MSTTPTTPQWAIEAAKEIHQQNTCWLEDRATLNEPTLAAIIAKHAPSPAAPPSDAARQAILRVAQKINTRHHNGYWSETMNPDSVVAADIEAALAPHLSQREPGDSELSKWQACAERLARAVESALGNDLSVKTEWKLSGALDEFAAIKSAQRGEGKP